MKIALLGNTCNNNFAWMRYFHDLGVDAHLLLYSDEGLPDSNLIHNPEWDTWEIEKWRSYIHRLPIPNGIEGLVGRPDKIRKRPSRSELHKIFDGYDVYIGSGISPGLFARMGKPLTIFYPYSTGIEWVGEGETKKKLKKINLELPFRWYVKKMQISGIKAAKVVANTMKDYTQEILDNYSVKTINKYIPQYYNGEATSYSVDDDLVKDLLKKTKTSEFSIFSHMRHHWEYNSQLYKKDIWPQFCKNNHWLIRAFSDFIKIYPKIDSKLILTAWGKDVESSIQLCSSLDIQKHVIWLPLLQRRQISWILSHACDLAVGEFVQCKGALWGSTAWEALAVGKPVMQTLNFSDQDYFNFFGHKSPPVFDVKSPDDVLIQMELAYLNKDMRESIGKLGKEWFDKHNGIALAKEWLNIIESVQSKQYVQP